LSRRITRAMWRHKHPLPPTDTHLGSGANLSTSKRACDPVSHTHYLRVFATGQNSEDIFVAQHSTCQPASLEYICLFTHSWFTRLGYHGSNPDGDKRFIFSKEAKTNLRPEYLRLFPLPPPRGGGIRPEYEAHHSPLSFTKAKNERSCTSTVPYAFMTTTTTALPLLRGIQSEGRLRMWSKGYFENMLTALQIPLKH